VSGRPSKRPSTRARSRRGALLPLLSALGIGAILLGLIVVILPDGFGGGGGDSNSANNTVQVTPGAEETQMRARLQKNPNDVDAMVILADLLANTGRSQESIQWYGKAVTLKPEDESLRIAFGTVLMQYDYELDAQIQLQKAHGLSPKDPQPLYLLGQLYENEATPQVEQARAMYQQAEAAQPASVYAGLAKDRLNALNGTPQAAPGATP
jgi:cytochrome c-type biogenesis protein CcmH/NrfG